MLTELMARQQAGNPDAGRPEHAAMVAAAQTLARCRAALAAGGDRNAEWQMVSTALCLFSQGWVPVLPASSGASDGTPDVRYRPGEARAQFHALAQDGLARGIIPPKLVTLLRRNAVWARAAGLEA